MKARTAVAALELLERRTHRDGELAVRHRRLALLATTPRVEAARPHLHDPAQDSDRVVGPLRLDESEPQWFRLAKKAVAFPRISTSISSRALSFRSCLSSSSSSGVSPVFSSACTISCQLLSTFGCTPSSREITLSGFSLVWSKRTASRLNSLLNFLRCFLATGHLILAAVCPQRGVHGGRASPLWTCTVQLRRALGLGLGTVSTLTTFCSKLSKLTPSLLDRRSNASWLLLDDESSTCTLLRCTKG